MNGPIARSTERPRRSLPLLFDGGRAEPHAARAPANVMRAEPRAVRLSITDRCDLACVYCRPSRRDGYLPSEQRLGPDHWRVLVAALIDKGVRRVRITGGEPLMHPQLLDIVAGIASLPGLEDLALTTNATRLATLAEPLARAGLRRVNVSLDSLDATRFFALSRGGSLADVLAGLEAAKAAGFAELKLNTVVVGPSPKDHVRNDDELGAIAELAWSLGATPRFLELMTVGEGAHLADRIVPYAVMRERLAPLLADEEPARQPDRGPAIYVQARAGSGLRVGFITGSSATFCAGCDRLRVSSQGMLRPCLATPDGVSVREAIDAGNAAEIGARLDEAWAGKPDGQSWKGCTEPTAARVNMRATGG